MVSSRCSNSSSNNNNNNNSHNKTSTKTMARWMVKDRQALRVYDEIRGFWILRIVRRGVRLLISLWTTGEFWAISEKVRDSLHLWGIFYPGWTITRGHRVETVRSIVTPVLITDWSDRDSRPLIKLLLDQTRLTGNLINPIHLTLVIYLLHCTCRFRLVDLQGVRVWLGQPHRWMDR